MNINVIIPTVSQEFPANTIGGNWLVNLFDAANTLLANVQSSGPTVTVTLATDLPDGAYTLTGQRLDGNGNPLGPVSNGTFKIPFTVAIDVASGADLTVTLS